jgi:hypothetical protein
MLFVAVSLLFLHLQEGTIQLVEVGGCTVIYSEQPTAVLLGCCAAASTCAVFRLLLQEGAIQLIDVCACTGSRVVLVVLTVMLVVIYALLHLQEGTIQLVDVGACTASRVVLTVLIAPLSACWSAFCMCRKAPFSWLM